MAARALRRRFHGSGGGELIHGAVHHVVFEGQAGYSLKYYEGGPVRFWRAGRLLELNGSGFLAINAGEPYGFEVLAPERTRVTAVFFQPEKVAAAWAAETTGGGAPLFSDWLHRAGQGFHAILADLRRARDAGQVSTSRVDDLLDRLLIGVVSGEAALTGARREFANTRRTQREETLRRISLACRFIEANLDRELTLDDVADAARLSRFYLLRRFQAVVGVTPMAYLRRERLSRAARQVAEGRRPLTEIALDCGYADLAAFSRAFHRRYGLAPSAVRTKRQSRPSQQEGDARKSSPWIEDCSWP